MSKITHVCLSAFYCEGYTYQENLLSRYHRKMGYDVDIIASLQSFDESGRPCILDETEDYVNDWGVHVIRLDYARLKRVCRILRKYEGFERALETSAPDILFVHGVQSAENKTLARYAAAHPQVAMYMDNHADYSNSATNWLSKHVLHRIVWRHYVRLVEPYVEKFWGVLPARVDFLVENYGLPHEKCDLLVMGADDEEVRRAENSKVRLRTRCDLGFSNNDFVVVTGGKIDFAKRQTLLLMDAVKRMESEVKLLVFGSVVPQLQHEVESRLEKERVVYVSWADASKSYDYFAAADVVVFPGRHSVYWEQAVGLGKPLVVKRWPGTDHVDVCGNTVFLEEDSVEAIVQAITQVRNALGVFNDAASKAASKFLYSQIAKKSVEGRDVV